MLVLYGTNLWTNFWPFSDFHDRKIPWLDISTFKLNFFLVYTFTAKSSRKSQEGAAVHWNLIFFESSILTWFTQREKLFYSVKASNFLMKSTKIFLIFWRHCGTTLLRNVQKVLLRTIPHCAVVIWKNLLFLQERCFYGAPIKMHIENTQNKAKWKCICTISRNKKLLESSTIAGVPYLSYF